MTEEVRLVDHQIEPGVVSDAVRHGDEWPEIRARLRAAEIPIVVTLIVVTPTWLGQSSSVANPRWSGWTRSSRKPRRTGTPIAYAAAAVVTGNEDAAPTTASPRTTVR